METKESAEPYVGMPATKYVGSDKYVWMVTEIQTAKRLVLTWDIGQGETRSKTVTLRKDGKWRPVGAKANCGSCFELGKCEEFQDPNF